jgi:hypothetical protein
MVESLTRDGMRGTGLADTHRDTLKHVHMQVRVGAGASQPIDDHESPQRRPNRGIASRCMNACTGVGAARGGRDCLLVPIGAIDRCCRVHRAPP